MKNSIGVRFDDTLKSVDHILSLVSRANGLIGWLVRNFRGSNRYFRIYRKPKQGVM